jgi:hypothetical protein
VELSQYSELALAKIRIIVPKYNNIDSGASRNLGGLIHHRRTIAAYRRGGMTSSISQCKRCSTICFCCHPTGDTPDRSQGTLPDMSVEDEAHMCMGEADEIAS